MLLNLWNDFISEMDIVMHPFGSMTLVFYAHVAPFTNMD